MYVWNLLLRFYVPLQYTCDRLQMSVSFKTSLKLWDLIVRMKTSTISFGTLFSCLGSLKYFKIQEDMKFERIWNWNLKSTYSSRKCNRNSNFEMLETWIWISYYPCVSLLFVNICYQTKFWQGNIKNEGNSLLCDNIQPLQIKIGHVTLPCPHHRYNTVIITL
jgi:hypothetical protein